MDVTDIRNAIVARMEELKPLVAEHERLEEAEKALASVAQPKKKRGRPKKV